MEFIYRAVHDWFTPVPLKDLCDHKCMDYLKNRLLLTSVSLKLIAENLSLVKLEKRKYFPHVRWDKSLKGSITNRVWPLFTNYDYSQSE